MYPQKIWMAKAHGGLNGGTVTVCDWVQTEANHSLLSVIYANVKSQTVVREKSLQLVSQLKESMNFVWQ